MTTSRRHDQAPPSDDWQRRFGGVARLFGAEAGAKLARARVLVVGIGGVGTWVAEGLARGGIGHIGLMDADDVCITNTNRQLHALDHTIGQAKTRAMADRLRAIHPAIDLTVHEDFFGTALTHSVTDGNWDIVVDAIDALAAKSLLLACCHGHGIPVITCGGAGGKSDGTLVRTDDLARSVQDPLLRQVRKTLRKDFGFPRGEGVLFGIPSVFSIERPVFPRADGTICTSPEPGSSLRLDCTSGFGTAAHVTGAFGLAAAGLAIRAVAGSGGQQLRPFAKGGMEGKLPVGAKSFLARAARPDFE